MNEGTLSISYLDLGVSEWRHSPHNGRHQDTPFALFRVQTKQALAMVL